MSSSRSRNAVWPSFGLRGVVELAGQRLGGGRRAAGRRGGRAAAGRSSPRSSGRLRRARRSAARSTTTSRPSAAEQPAAAASRGSGPGRPVALCGHRAGRVVNADSTTRSSAARCSALRTMLPAPGGASRCDGQQRRRRASGSRRSRAPEPVAQLQRGAGEAGRHRVAVAPERDRRVRGHDPGHLDRRRERRRRAAPAAARRRRARRRSCAAPVAVRRSRASPGRRGTGPATPAPPPVVVAVIVRHHRPHSVAHRGLDRALAVPAPRWARLHDRAVVLGHRREAMAARHGCRARSPSPAGRCARPGRCRRGGASPRPSPRSDAAWSSDSASTPADPARVRQRAQQHVRGAAPRRPAPLEPVPLDLLARRVVDLDRVAALHPRARLAVRPQAAAGGPGARTSGSCAGSRARRPRRTATSPTDAGHRRTGPGCRPRTARADRAPTRGPDTGLAVAVQIGADRLAVALEMAGDGRDRPAPFLQRVGFHVFSLCEHGSGAPSMLVGVRTASVDGAPPRLVDPAGSTQPLRGGEFQ